MEYKENISAVVVFESMLSNQTSDLRKRLLSHKANIDSIRRAWENDKDAAEKTRTTSLEKAEAKLKAELNDAESTFLSRSQELDQQFSSQRNTQNATSKSIMERTKNQEAELGRCRNAWQQYINAVHQSFTNNIDESKKSRTKSLHEEWQNLNKRADQVPLDQNGHLEYGHKSPFFYALSHPFANVPEWYIKARIVFLAIAMLWIAILIGMCMWDAYWDYSTESFFASNAVKYSFFCLLGYFVLAYIGGFISAFSTMRKSNEYRKYAADIENKLLVDDIADAKAKLSAFEKTYKPLFCATGKWNWDWHYYHVSKSDAEKILDQSKKQNSHLHPGSTGGVGEYTFAINYESL